MTADLDHATSDAVEALVYRLRNRGDDEGQYATDPEVFAREFMAAMRGRGWRPVEALAPWESRGGSAGSGLPESEETSTRVEQTRRELDAIRARQHEERQRLAVAEPPAGAA